MRPYTIIFDNGSQVGSHYNAITAMQRVVTDDLGKLLKQEFEGCAWFIFEGHPHLEGEFDDLQYQPKVKTYQFHKEGE